MPEPEKHLPTPGAVLDYWIGAATDDHLFANRQHKLWFAKSDQADAFIAAQFGPLHTALEAGLSEHWAAAGPRARLAAIIVLDQFSRNMFRGTRAAFASDTHALELAKAGIESGEDRQLTEVERVFFYLPFEHSEAMTDQKKSVRVFETLLQDARSTFRPKCVGFLDYAHQHRDVIERFGRFPHRNAVLGRTNTEAEAEYLSKPGAGF